MYTPAASDFGALAYGTPHQGTLNYIRQKYETMTATLSEQGRQFMETAQRLHDQFMGSAAIRKARAVKEKLLDGMFLRNEVQQYSTIGQFQSATPMMQGYVMAHPAIKQMYYDQRLDGYDGSWVDTAPGCLGWDDPAYRRVMNGIVQDHPLYDYHIRTVIEDVDPDEQPLLIDQKAKVLATWEALLSHLEAGKEDPTSTSGGWL